MDRILGYLVMVYIFLPWRPMVVLVHGLFFLPNRGRHRFDGDVLFKATNCTTGYHVAWWILTVGSCIGWLVDATFSVMKSSAFVGSDKE